MSDKMRCSSTLGQKVRRPCILGLQIRGKQRGVLMVGKTGVYIHQTSTQDLDSRSTSTRVRNETPSNQFNLFRTVADSDVEK